MINEHPILKRLADAMPRDITLVDVGASGDPLSTWMALASRTHYIGFEPDARDIKISEDGPFKKTSFVPRAVAPFAEGGKEVPFYFTDNAHCSSLLEPDLERLAPYPFVDYFGFSEVGSSTAVSLAEGVQETGEQRIDWLKLDVQGVDLDLYQSLPGNLRSSMLALDFEAGLIHAYKGEKLFSTGHPELMEEGWWISRLHVCGDVRMARETLSKRNLHEPTVRKHTRISPGWVEARYLKSPEHVVSEDLPLLAVLAFVDAQYGVTLDVLSSYDDLDPALEDLRQFSEDVVSGKVSGQLGHEERTRWQDLQCLTQDDVLRRFSVDELAGMIRPSEWVGSTLRRWGRRLCGGGKSSSLPGKEIKDKGGK